MDIFSSPWLIKMLEKSSQYPRERLLNLFDILEDWSGAPDIKLEISPTNHSPILVEYLTTQARAIHAESPDMLAEHIVLIARNAAIQTVKLAENQHLKHAKKAVNALILAQTQKKWRFESRKKTASFGIAASVMFVFGLAVFWHSRATFNEPNNIAKAGNTRLMMATPAVFKPESNKLTAQDAALMYEKFEQMRKGTCHFPEALQIPDKHKAVYLESVVGGKLPNDLTDLAIANTYLEKVRCSYTPMLMANSK